MRTLLILFTIFPISLPGQAKEKRQPRPELCALKSAAIIGNSEAATIARRELKRRTWLKLESDPGRADALLEISETRSTKRFPTPREQVTVSATLRQGEKTLWSGSASSAEGVFNSGAGSAAKSLLSDHLAREARCGKQ